MTAPMLPFVELADPPGQAMLFRPAPTARRPRWLRVVAPDGTRTTAIRDLPVAAGRAAATAEISGRSWLLADDRSFCQVTATGDVTPTTGWPTAAARVIHSRTSSRTRKPNLP